MFHSHLCPPYWIAQVTWPLSWIITIIIIRYDAMQISFSFPIWRRQGGFVAVDLYRYFDIHHKLLGIWEWRILVWIKKLDAIRTDLLICCVLCFRRCVTLCCLRFSPGFEGLSDRYGQNQSSHRLNNHKPPLVPTRSLIGSFIPNPFVSARRKKYSERRLIGYVIILTIS